MLMLCITTFSQHCSRQYQHAVRNSFPDSSFLQPTRISFRTPDQLSRFWWLLVVADAPATTAESACENMQRGMTALMPPPSDLNRLLEADDTVKAKLKS